MTDTRQGVRNKANFAPTMSRCGLGPWPGRLPCDSEHKHPGLRPFLVCIRRFGPGSPMGLSSALLPVTLRLFATRGFASIRAGMRGLRPLLSPSLRSTRKGHAISVRRLRRQRLCSIRAAHDDSALLPVTLRILRNGPLLTAPPKMPLCPAGIACFSVCAVRCGPAPGCSALLCFT